jgi:hypothetical protein
MRWLSVLLTACNAVALAGCGGDGQQVERRTDTTPRIERAVADRLAARSDKVANLLESGDSCGAAEEAAGLRADLNASLARIPELYLEDLSGLVNEIQAQIPPCAQSAEDDDADDDGRKKEHEKKQKKKGKKKHGNDDG